MERRLRRLGPDTLARPERRNYQDLVLQRQGRSRLKWDVETEQLCWRILNEANPDARAALARNVADSWGYSNASLAYFMPWLLELATREQGLTGAYIVQGVGKLLCNEDRRLWLPALEACEQFVFNVEGPPALLHEIGLGKAVCVRLLLDAAEYAWSRGAAEYAVNATWAVSTLIERNFEDHPFIGEVMLHRLYYLDGPVLGWALDKIGSGMGGYLFRDADRLIRFIDDLAIERPAIASVVAAPIRFLSPKTDSEYVARSALLPELKSPAAREATLRHLYPPESLAEASAVVVVDAMVPLFPDPVLGAAAVQVVARLIGGPGKTPDAIERLVDEGGDGLPERLRVEYLWKFPDTRKLDRTRIVEWQPQSDPPEASEAGKAREAWDMAIRRAVTHRDEGREALRTQADRVRGVDAPIFDRSRDELATAPPVDEKSEPLPSLAPSEPREEPRPAAAPPHAEAALGRYLQRMQVLQAQLEELARGGGDLAANSDYQRLIVAMQQAVNDYTADVDKQAN
jgi:hypothetical protein